MVLDFSLSPDATGRIYELLACLAKFGDTVSVEARAEKLTLTALNSSRTAYASFSLDPRTFFINYDFDVRNPPGKSDRFTCQLYNRALQSVFKGRNSDGRGRDAIEQCDVSIQDQPDKTECRLIVKMKSKHGMTKTHRLTYESVEIMHALFDKTTATQGWKISSRVLREYIEYFAPKAEQLDLCADNGKAVFTSFTEKVDDGKFILKQPLETSISIHTSDFDDFHMQEGVHIHISVRDFRAIVTHAETLKGPISAYYSQPTRPLQFSYQNHGVHSEFTLMTTGDGRGASLTPNPKFVSTRNPSRQSSAVPVQSGERLSSQMPPPARPAAIKPLSSQAKGRTFQGVDRTTTMEELDPESLFVPQDNADEDRTWDPPNYERDDEEEMLGWDASNDNLSASMRPTVRDSGRPARASESTRNSTQFSEGGLAPTQRLSQLQGMFD